MPLLRDGTVLRRTPLPRYPNTAGNATGPRPDSDDILGLDKGTPSCDVAPIEDVRQIVAGLSSTITFTFKAIEGEELERPRPSTGYTILCAEDNRVNQRVWEVFSRFFSPII
jgi:hypothetical protein